MTVPVDKMNPIPRARPGPPLMTVDEAVQADRDWFAAHPDQDEYIREFVPGEFGARELPEFPSGFRYATHVSVFQRIDGLAVGRYRQLMAVCDDERVLCL
jgi:hypothetical protein